MHDLVLGAHKSDMTGDVGTPELRDVRVPNSLGPLRRQPGAFVHVVDGIAATPLGRPRHRWSRARPRRSPRRRPWFLPEEHVVIHNDAFPNVSPRNWGAVAQQRLVTEAARRTQDIHVTSLRVVYGVKVAHGESTEARLPTPRLTS